MAYDDLNAEGLTFAEWLQAAGHFKNDPLYDGRCAPYTRSKPYYIGLDDLGREVVLHINLPPNKYRVIRRSGTIRYFSQHLRNAWRNGEDPSEHLHPNASDPCQPTGTTSTCP